MYRDMLDQQWEDGSLPSDPSELVALLGGTLTEWRKCLPVLLSCFAVLDSGRLQNQRLEKEREKQQRRRDKAKLGAAASNAHQDSKRRLEVTGAPLTLVTSDALHLQVASAGCPLPVAGASDAPATARSKRPIFAGQRLTVHEWLLDECMRTLGDHTDAFDLHDWFFQVDQMAVNSGLVIPKRDGGEWLLAQLVAEAQRRGLPLRMAVASSQVAGKLTARLAAAVANINREAAR